MGSGGRGGAADAGAAHDECAAGQASAVTATWAQLQHFVHHTRLASGAGLRHLKLLPIAHKLSYIRMVNGASTMVLSQPDDDCSNMLDAPACMPVGAPSGGRVQLR